VPVLVIGPPVKVIPLTEPAVDTLVTVPVPPGAYDADIANDAVVAKEAVPKSDPVIPADTLSDPVICVLFNAMMPLRAINSFAISIL
jgi:hypothetical protein